MSGLRDNLDDWALGHGASLAENLGSTEGAARTAIRRRRRRRAVAVAATALAAVAGVGAIASGLPGNREVPPASNSQEAVTMLACGIEWTLSRGVTTYEPGADFYFDVPHGQWVRTDDSGAVQSDPTSVSAGFEALHWQGELDLHGAVAKNATIVAVRDGMIVGSYEEDAARYSEYDGSHLTVAAPYPGVCGNDAAPATSGTVTYHLVVEVIETRGDERVLASIVDPGGPVTVSMTGLEDWGAALTVQPAELREPVGDTYQAFVLSSGDTNFCTRLQNSLAAGHPSVDDPQYTVTLPGVQPLSSGMWTGDPVLVEPESVLGTWFAQDGMSLVATDMSGMGEPLLVWDNDATTLASAGFNNDFSGECDFASQGEIHGAVFLVINGVDWTAFWAQNPDATHAGSETWIYLGQAG